MFRLLLSHPQALLRYRSLTTTFKMHCGIPNAYTCCPKYIKNLMKFRVFYVYGSVHRNIFYEITNRCSYMQSILFHC